MFWSVARGAGLDPVTICDGSTNSHHSLAESPDELTSTNDSIVARTQPPPGGGSVRVCAMVFFHANALLPASALKERLGSEYQIAVSATNPSAHCLAPEDDAVRTLTEAVRVSPHCFNTESEIDQLLAAVAAILEDACGA